jgi:predicted  nucleic acid-binding Zn-ribbon protein
MALSEIREASKKLILGEARLHNNKIEDEISRLEEEARYIEQEISYQRARLRAKESKIVDIREHLITISK